MDDMVARGPIHGRGADGEQEPRDLRLQHDLRDGAAREPQPDGPRAHGRHGLQARGLPRRVRAHLPLAHSARVHAAHGALPHLLYGAAALGALGPMNGSWNHWAVIPATTILAIFLFGIEELGIQIEEPFGILPLEALCDTSIEGVVMDMQESYKKGFFGELRDGTP